MVKERSSKKERRVDALALRAEERRDKLRKAAGRELGWEAQYGSKEMCADSWRWQKNNPNGYDD